MIHTITTVEQHISAVFDSLAFTMSVLELESCMFSFGFAASI